MAYLIMIVNLTQAFMDLVVDIIMISEAQKVGGVKTKKATVNQALSELIQKRKQLETLKLFGKIDFDPSYDYKKERQRP